MDSVRFATRATRLCTQALSKPNRSAANANVGGPEKLGPGFESTSINAEFVLRRRGALRPRGSSFVSAIIRSYRYSPFAAGRS